jgi:hypothetical protein
MHISGHRRGALSRMRDVEPAVTDARSLVMAGWRRRARWCEAFVRRDEPMCRYPLWHDVLSS